MKTCEAEIHKSKADRLRNDGADIGDSKSNGNLL